jgi:hypothetical protein
VVASRERIGAHCLRPVGRAAVGVGLHSAHVVPAEQALDLAEVRQRPTSSARAMLRGCLHTGPSGRAPIGATAFALRHLDYLRRWFPYVRTHILDFPSALAYLQRHPRAPQAWSLFLVSWLEPLAKANPRGALALDRAQVDALGLVGDDVAYRVYIRNAQRDGGMTAPWTWRVSAESPAQPDAIRWGRPWRLLRNSARRPAAWLRPVGRIKLGSSIRTAAFPNEPC